MKEARAVRDSLTGSVTYCCPQCGSGLPASADEGQKVTCAYCETQSVLPKLKEAAPAVEPAALPLLPSGLSGLKRPKAGSPANPAGCFALVFGIAWMMFSSVFMVIGVGTMLREQQEYELLVREGRLVQGMVTRLEIDEDDDLTSYDVYYRYPVMVNDQQVTYTGYQSVSEDLYFTLRESQDIEVVYAPSQPETASLKADLAPPQVWVFGVVIFFGLSFDVVGFFILTRTWKTLLQRWRLQKNGQTVQATVFERWTESDSEGGTSYAVAYAFSALMPDGSVRLVTRGEYNHAAYVAVPVGGTLQVRYLPENPEVNRIVHD